MAVCKQKYNKLVYTITHGALLITSNPCTISSRVTCSDKGIVQESHDPSPISLQRKGNECIQKTGLLCHGEVSPIRDIRFMCCFLLVKKKKTQTLTSKLGKPIHILHNIDTCHSFGHSRPILRRSGSASRLSKF